MGIPGNSGDIILNSGEIGIVSRMARMALCGRSPPLDFKLLCSYTITMAMRFEWDPLKDRINGRKHGISFEEAQTAFYDENARLIPDPGHSDAEDRFILLGMSGKSRVLLVCHCYRESASTIRIISARKSTPKERSQYEEFLL